MPARFKRMYPQMDGKCWRCQKDEAGFVHIWWECGKLKAVGMQVYNIMQKIFWERVGLVSKGDRWLLSDFACCKMGSSKVLMANILAAAMTLIASTWKSSDVPTVGEWLRKIRYMGPMGKLSAICSYRAGRENALEEFREQWESLFPNILAFMEFMYMLMY